MSQFEVDIVSKGNQPVPTIIGQIRYSGICIEQVNGSVFIPVDSNGTPVSFKEEWKLKPDEPTAVLQQISNEIAASLASRQVVGDTRGYHWQVSEEDGSMP